MDRFIAHTNATPAVRYRNTQTSEIKTYAPAVSQNSTDTTHAQAHKKAKTSVTLASEKRKKAFEQEEKRRKLRLKNGIIFSVNGTLERVHRPWDKTLHPPSSSSSNASSTPPPPPQKARVPFVRRRIVCDGTGACTQINHSHDLDCTLLGRELWVKPTKINMEKSLDPELQTADADAANEVHTALGVAATEPRTDAHGAHAAHAYHPFLATTNPAVLDATPPPSIVSDVDAECARLHIENAELVTAIQELFEHGLRSARERVNAEHMHTHHLRFIDESHSTVASFEEHRAPSPSRLVLELEVLREKRKTREQNIYLSVTQVLDEAYDKFVRDIVERCIAADLLGAGALHTASTEIHAHHAHFMRTRDERLFFEHIVQIFDEERKVK